MSTSPEIPPPSHLASFPHPTPARPRRDVEKLLLFSGAIQIAGSVKARKAAATPPPDWMEMEKERGISVASSR